MADIRIKDLPLATGGTAPIGSDAVAIDGSSTRKTTITALGDVAVPVASQAEAEAGINAVKRMTPLTVKQSIASEVGDTLASAAQGALADSAIQPSSTRLLPSGGTTGQALLKSSNTDYATAWGSVGDMTKSTYDPTNVNGDAFSLSNHTGQLPASALATAAEGRAAASASKAVPAVAAVLDPTLQRAIARGYGIANARDYGAVLDGTTDDSAAITAALAAYPTVYIPPSTSGCRLNSTVTLSAQHSIVGDPRRSKIVHGGSSNLFAFAGSDLAVSGLYVDATNNTAGFTFFANTTSTMERINLENIYTENGKGLIADANSTGQLITFKLKDVSARFHKGRGILLNDAWAFLEMQNVYVDFLNNPSATNQVGIEINSNEGSVLSNVEVTGSSGIIAGTNGSQIGFNFNNCKSMKAYNVFADACGGYGLRMDACDFMKFSQPTLNICNDSPLLINNSQRIKVSDAYIGGRRGLSGAAVTIPVVNVIGGSKIGFNACEIENGTGDGISASGCGGLTVIGGGLVNNVGRGIRTSGSSVVKLVGTDILVNTEGLYVLATANDYIRSCRNNAGALIDVQGPATA